MQFVSPAWNFHVPTPLQGLGFPNAKIARTETTNTWMCFSNTLAT